MFSSASHSRYLISIYLYITPTSGSLIFATDDGCWSSETGYVENAGPGSRGAESRGTGSRGVENCAGSSGKRGVWKTRGLVENARSSGKRGVHFFSSKCELYSLK